MAEQGSVTGMNRPPCVDALLQSIERAVPALLAIDEDASRRQPRPGAWSPREVIGHLIDSASNNHQRFVRAQFQEDLVFPGYDQDAWVRVQRYAESSWHELVTLWAAFNRHIAHVMDAVPADARDRARSRHNLHELAWVPPPNDGHATLGYFMADYVGHLRHHLRQILDIREHPWLATGSIQP
jgi:hypothetical protein